MAHTFARLHVPSGRVQQCEFNASHHEAFADDGRNFGCRTIDSAKQALIDKWNRQQPTEWKYSL